MLVRTRKRPVSGYKRDVLKLLARLQYVTVSQLQYWSEGRHISRSYAAIDELVKLGYVKIHKAIKPYIFSLTREGFRIAGAKPPGGSRQESWSVLTHRCHRNEAEMRLRTHFADFQFLSRQEMYRLGVNPAFGEHLGITEGRMFFVLLDDYHMDPSRISHAIERAHRPNTDYFDIALKRVPTWGDIAEKVIIAVSDDDQYSMHKRYIQKHELAVALLKIEALW